MYYLTGYNFTIDVQVKLPVKPVHCRSFAQAAMSCCAQQTAFLQRTLPSAPTNSTVFLISHGGPSVCSSPAGQPSHNAAVTAASMSLAAMQRVASVEYPHLCWSKTDAVIETAAPVSHSAMVNSCSNIKMTAQESSTHGYGRVLSGGAWLAPKLVSRDSARYLEISPASVKVSSCEQQGATLITGMLTCIWHWVSTVSLL